MSSHNTLRLIDYSINPGHFNMACDSFFLKAKELEPTLRFYGWTRPTLSFGKSQKNITDIDWDFCNRENFDYVRRPSGGKCVFHHLELTYSLIFPLSLTNLSILDCYKQISTALIKALAIDELDMADNKKPTSQSSNCFVDVSNWEVSYNDKKLIGSAQTRTREAVLQHGSILLDINPDYWQNIWVNKSSLQRITSLKEITGRDIEIKMLINSIGTEIADIFKLDVYSQNLTAYEKESIAKLEGLFTFDNN